MKNLKQLLGICEHIWEIFEKTRITTEIRGCIGHIYVLKCKKCGKLKKFKVEV